MRDHLHLYVNGTAVDVRGDDAFLTLSEFLRRRRRLTGTKVVCAEGDCGSCAVLVGRSDAVGIRYASVTSCIQFLFQLDATHVITVEGLRDGKKLNPIQQAMVTCQGTQCGFCTPGFVVSLYDHLHEGREADAETLRRSLVGNLCRCTGYDSILKAACATDRAALKPLDKLYPPVPLSADLARAALEPVLIETPTRRFFKATTVTDACRFRAAHPHCTVVAGATDVGVIHNKRLREVTAALSVSGIGELLGVGMEPDALYAGAAATLTELEARSLVHIPELGRFLAWFGSPLIKNAGTIGGNLVNASPIGDTIPAMIALGAEVDIAGATHRRRLPIGEFYCGYRTTVLDSDELLTQVRIPIPVRGEIFKLYKVSRRKDLDISSFGAAIWLGRDTTGSITDVRIAYGGVGPMVMRMTRAEEVLRGATPTLDRFDEAARLAAEQVTPITDVRGSDAYRRALCRNILLRFWHEVFGTRASSDGDGGGGHDGSNDGGSNGNGMPHAPGVAAPRVSRDPIGLPRSKDEQ
jgi:xanthine dehydrogenase small subunit